MVSKTDPPETIKVLMIDDAPVDARIVRRHIEDIDEWSVDFEHVESPERGISIIGEENVDVVLLDYSLRHTTGMDIVHRLRDQGYRVPIILITGHGTELVARTVIDEGGNDYMSKHQLNSSKLKQSIDFVVEHKWDKQSWFHRADRKNNVYIMDSSERIRLHYCFDLVLQDCMKSANENGKTFCLALMDVVNFDDLNELDQTLIKNNLFQSIAGILEENLHKRDAFCRYNECEFAMILRYRTLSEAHEISQQICDEIDRMKLELPNGDFLPDCRIGFGEFNSTDYKNADKDTVRALIEQADQALNYARNQEHGSIERRSSPREEIEPVPIDLMTKQGKSEGLITEHSREGIRVRLDEEITAKESVSIKLREPDTLHGQIEFEGTVRWCHWIENGNYYQVGVETLIPRGLLTRQNNRTVETENHLKDK